MDIPDGGSITFNLILFIVSLSLSALFSFLETGMMALRLFQLKEMAQKTGKYEKLFQALEKDPNRLLNSILIAYNLASIVAATAAGFAIQEPLMAILPSSISYVIAVMITTVAITIFGDILPKNLVKVNGEEFFASTLWLTNLTFYLMSPFSAIMGHITKFFVRVIMGKSEETEEPVTSEKEIRFLLSYIDEKGLMDKEKTNMLQSIFRLGSTHVRDIMVPMPDVIMIDVSKSIQEAYELFKKYQYSRMPVYREDHNNVIGMLHFKDLVPVMARNAVVPITDLMRTILFVPESIRVNELLKELKNQHLHIAMVINEHGSITGIATLEDVLEEIVGEIHDEYESITEKVVPVEPEGWMANASIELEKIAPMLKITFETESAVTLGGFLMEQLQHLPKVGERLIYKDYTFQMEEVTVKKINRVLITKTEHGGQLMTSQEHEQQNK